MKYKKSTPKYSPGQSPFPEIPGAPEIIVNWFPGHMKRTSDLIKNLGDKLEAVVEILDARIPASGRNSLIFELTSHLPRLIVLNKCDLADPRTTSRWENHFNNQGYAVMSLSATGGSSQYGKKIQGKTGELLRSLLGNPRTFTAMACGIPNVGKSTFINLITGGKKTKVGNRPGITRDKQFIKIDSTKPWALVDMPGLLMPKLNAEESFRLSLCGVIKERIYDLTELGCNFLKFFLYNADQNRIDSFTQLYDLPSISSLENTTELSRLEMIAKRRGYFLKNREIDYEHAASTVIRDFQAGKLGRISLEDPDFK